MTIQEDKERVYQIILSLAKLFSSRCNICHKKCKQGKGFAIHHIIYKQEEKKYSDFKKPSGENDRLRYYQYLEPIVRSDKKRFTLLCNTCHSAVTHGVRWGRLKYNRLDRLIRKSHKQHI